jgi:Tfp pilus assembly protein PilV
MPAVNRITQQSGVTLLEVLVGFVIFTSSLVAVLNYIANQVYLGHRVDNTYQMVKLVHQLVIGRRIGDEEVSRLNDEYHALHIDLDSHLINEASRTHPTNLMHTQYTISDGGADFTWSVLEVTR